MAIGVPVFLIRTIMMTTSHDGAEKYNEDEDEDDRDDDDCDL